MDGSSKIENLRSGDKGYFRAMLEIALEKRVQITMDQAKSGDLPPVNPQDIQSVVFLPEKKSHLYPWILETAYKLAGREKDEAYHNAISDAGHENQHGGVAGEGTTVYYCVRFFDVQGSEGYPIGVQAFTTILGEVSTEEAQDIHSAPDALSQVDKNNLREST